MLVLTPDKILECLGQVRCPYLGKDIKSAGLVQGVAIEAKRVHVHIQYPYPVADQLPHVQDTIRLAIEKDYPEYELDIKITWSVRRHRVQKDVKQKLGIKNIIAVASGKGGVGKSTVAVHLALALQGMGAKVALLDADIYGPSQPKMLGKQGEHAFTHNKKILPVESMGIQSVSIGYLINDDSAMIWRGPMVSSALQQLLNETAWEPCDYMIIDLPPGTGDIQLTMAQKIPISGAVVVTTPQDISLIDARKACKMFEKVEVPVLGIVENMSWHICQQCGHQEAIFGQAGGQQLATESGLPLLAQLPLDATVRAMCDAGTPVIVTCPNSDLAAPYWALARNVAAQLAGRPVDYQVLLEDIVVTA